MTEQPTTIITQHGELSTFEICSDITEFPHYAEPDRSIRHPNAVFYKVPDGVYTLAYDEISRQPAFAKVSHFSEHGGDGGLPLMKTSLSSGSEIFTDDDPRAIYGIDPDTLEMGRWRPMASVDKFVPRISKVPITTTYTEWQFTVPANVKNDLLPECKIPLDFDFGYLIGLLLGDGWIERFDGKNRCVCLSCTEQGIADGFRFVLEKIFKVQDITITERIYHKDDPGSYGDSKTLAWSNRYAAECLEPLIPHSADKKCLPAWIFSSPIDFRCGVISGLIDTDGTMSISHSKKNPQYLASYHSISLKLVQELQYLFKGFGVRSSICLYKTPLGKQAYNLVISMPSLIPVREQLCLRHPVKHRVLMEATASRLAGSGARMEQIPMPISLARAIRSLTYQGHRCYSALSEVASGNRKKSISKTIAELIVSEFGADPVLNTHMACVWKKLIAESDKIVWDRVMSADLFDISEKLYDLTVPGYETFTNPEGIILSNTTNFHVPVSKKAIDEAYAKMMPEHNLIGPRFGKIMYPPEKEYLQGLYMASRRKDTSKAPKTFDNLAAARKAYAIGKIDIDDPIIIAEEQK